MDPITLLAALGPLALDLGKSLIGRFITKGDYKPVNVDEWLKMRGADLDQFRAINEAGGNLASYPWVAAVISLQRPLVAAVALSVWAWSQTAGTPSEDINNFAAVIGFYLFGDRTLFHAKKAGAGGIK